MPLGWLLCMAAGSPFIVSARITQKTPLATVPSLLHDRIV
jgi:elongation factor P hydroxylase